MCWGAGRGPGRCVRCSRGWDPRTPALAVPPGGEVGLRSPQAVGLQGQPGLGEHRVGPPVGNLCPPGWGEPLCGSPHCLLTFWVRFATCGISRLHVVRVRGGCPPGTPALGLAVSPWLVAFISLISQRCCISARRFPHCQFPGIDYRAFFLTLEEFHE